MSEENARPALKAEGLPLGTVMVLGGTIFELYGNDGRCLSFELNSGTALAQCVGFSVPEIQELIDRGVRFEMPKGGA